MQTSPAGRKPLCEVVARSGVAVKGQLRTAARGWGQDAASEGGAGARRPDTQPGPSPRRLDLKRTTNKRQLSAQRAHARLSLTGAGPKPGGPVGATGGAPQTPC
ncbi:hypothetical protein NN561_017494 [Cricetulus griseus]